MSGVEPGSPKYFSGQFWIDCLLNQVYEAAEDLAKGDMAHMEKELADAAAVALDAIRILYNHDGLHVIIKRWTENIPKMIGERDGSFYAEKTRGIKARIGDICP